LGTVIGEWHKECGASSNFIYEKQMRSSGPR